MIQTKRCKKCSRTLRDYNQSGFCSACNREIWRKKKAIKFKCDKCGKMVNERLKYYKKKRICKSCWMKFRYKHDGYRNE